MNFETSLPAIAALMTSLVGLRVDQRNMPQKVTDPKVKGKLVYTVTSCISNGLNDDVRFVYNAGTGLLDVVVSGLRTFTLSVRFEGYDQSLPHDALYYLERLGTRLIYPSSLATLAALDVSLIRRLSFQDLSRILSAEDRVWSVGQKDFVFQCVVTYNPTDGGADSPSSWIEHVQVLSDDLLGEDGLALPGPMQINTVIDRG